MKKATVSHTVGSLTPFVTCETRSSSNLQCRRSRSVSLSTVTKYISMLNSGNEPLSTLGVTISLSYRIETLLRTIGRLLRRNSLTGCLNVWFIFQFKKNRRCVFVILCWYRKVPPQIKFSTEWNIPIQCSKSFFHNVCFHTLYNSIDSCVSTVHFLGKKSLKTVLSRYVFLFFTPYHS